MKLVFLQVTAKGKVDNSSIKRVKRKINSNKKSGPDDKKTLSKDSGVPSHLGLFDYGDFAKLHRKTITHWKDQHKKNKDDLDKILESDDDIMVHDHSVKRKPTVNLTELYKSRTIELCVITDPHLFDLVKTMFDLETDREVNMKIYKEVHSTLLSTETFLKHSSISKNGGGFRFKINGVRVLKDWGHMAKMKKRENIQDVLFDLGDYMQVLGGLLVLCHDPGDKP